MKPKLFAIVKYILSFYVYNKPALHEQTVIQFVLAFCLCIKQTVLDLAVTSYRQYRPPADSSKTKLSQKVTFL